MHPNAVVQFMASSIILAVHSNVSYLLETKLRSRAARHFHIANKTDEEYNNGAILTLSTIIRYNVASASDAKSAALFYNALKAVPPCFTLEEIGHPQLPTLLITDNNTAHRLTTDVMMPKRSKMAGICFHWLKCYKTKKQYNIKWKQGSEN
eukprot:12230501-Ditylum_brightwellii.AAC.1